MTNLTIVNNSSIAPKFIKDIKEGTVFTWNNSWFIKVAPGQALSFNAICLNSGKSTFTFEWQEIIVPVKATLTIE